MQASQATTIQVTPSGGLQVTAPQQMRPLTSREIDAIRDRRDDIRTQLNSAVDRRNDLAGDLKDAPPGTEAGILARIQLLDARVLQIERDMEESGRMLRTGLTVDNGTMLVAPRQRGFEGMGSDQVEMMTLGFGFFVMLPLAIIFMRRMWNRGRRAAATTGSAEQDARMERLEQAVDAIAIEIERVGESQRYQTRVLAEANLIPAMGAALKEPIRARE